TLVDIDLAKLDIWHYKDDYLQPAQLKNLAEDLKESFLAVYDFNNNNIHQLGSKELPDIIQTNEGDGDTFIGVTDYGKRIESQWTGRTKKDIYAIDINTGTRKLIKENLYGTVYPSSTGKYILWYDREAKNYFTWDGETSRNITQKIKVPLYDEENDIPDEPTPYGVMGWQERDSAVYVYDRYDIWKVDPVSKEAPIDFIHGREFKNQYRYLQINPEERFITSNQQMVIQSFDETDKRTWVYVYHKMPDSSRPLGGYRLIIPHPTGYAVSRIIKARNDEKYVYTKENFASSPDIYVNYGEKRRPNVHDGDFQYPVEYRMSVINPQQQNYLWGTAELFKWKAYNGKQATGLVYKPENFDPKKKYPMICYFYEKLSDNLYKYYPPAPIRSAINIPFYTSRGYIIFIPDIEYKIGHPGKSAYDYVVSGARALVKKGFVDSTNMAIQGHSWGGYQVAQLITMTKLFKAAWAGAPVANMTSAYGGIRWETGINRQFQYEKTQSRIGATLWDKPQLYIENSP
ncbi:MAG: prolyl oligopeptidase family serine peptidase, partial [Bacteroidota bacterium]